MRLALTAAALDRTAVKVEVIGAEGAARQLQLDLTRLGESVDETRVLGEIGNRAAATAAAADRRRGRGGDASGARESSRMIASTDIGGTPITDFSQISAA